MLSTALPALFSNSWNFTREVRTRSFDLIITFFHQPFFDISETRGPRLVSCATQRLMRDARMFQFAALLRSGAEIKGFKSAIFWTLSAEEDLTGHHIAAMLSDMELYLWSMWWARASLGFLRSCFRPGLSPYTPSSRWRLELKSPCCSAVSVTTWRGDTDINVWLKQKNRSAQKKNRITMLMHFIFQQNSSSFGAN